MTQSLALRLGGEKAYQRLGLFGIECLDAVTLERVTDGLRVVAEGLAGKPIINFSGRFVWLHEDLNALRRVTIDPDRLPYQSAELAPAEIQAGKLITVQLVPRVGYAFPAGVTALRGRIVESRGTPVAPAVAIPDAGVRLQWLDQEGVWQDALGPSRSDAAGEFATALRLTPRATPKIERQPQRFDAGEVTVRLRVTRLFSERQSPEFRLPRGRVADPVGFGPGPDALVFAWDELELP